MTDEGCSGDRLLFMLEGATTWLERHVERLNRLNVFPVPDGDTGTNMLLTMQAAVEAARQHAPVSPGRLMHAAGRGALMGARGNSGVILSQLLHGIAEELSRTEQAGPQEVAAALARGAYAAYGAMVQPVEGTILTVARDAGEAAQRAAAAGGDLEAVFAAAARAACESVAHTPALLPVLREAGVVDAGGEGYALLLEGCVLALRGELDHALTDPAHASERVAAETPFAAALFSNHSPTHEGYGYCTEFVIQGSNLDVTAVRREIMRLGDSVQVVGEPDLVHVHVHTPDPGRALSFAVSLGSLTSIKIENMDLQHAALAQQAAGAGTPRPCYAGVPPVQVVAVSPGDGFNEVFRRLGATAIVPGGKSMNPSIQELLRAVVRLPAPAVVLLPNNKNVLAAARQVATLARGKRVVVVPARSAPQGIAALLAYAPDRPLEELEQRMGDAIALVRTIELARAVRSTVLRGMAVHAGAYIGLVDGELIAAGSDREAVLLEAFAAAGVADREIVTLYWGGELTAADADALAAALHVRYPHLEAEAVYGGQPAYDVVASLE